MNSVNVTLSKKTNIILIRIKDNSDFCVFGKIKFIRAAFHEIPIENMGVDALVSVSAIEHADKNLMDANLSEMTRVVKKGGPLLITTSATDNGEDIFDKKTLGWCFALNSLKKMASINGSVKFEYKETEKEILNSKLWRSRIDPYYTNDPESIFFKRKMKKLPYLAVGLKLIKL